MGLDEKYEMGNIGKWHKAEKRRAYMNNCYCWWDKIKYQSARISQLIIVKFLLPLIRKLGHFLVTWSLLVTLLQHKP